MTLKYDLLVYNKPLETIDPKVGILYYENQKLYRVFGAQFTVMSDFDKPKNYSYKKARKIESLSSLPQSVLSQITHIQNQIQVFVNHKIDSH
ncbi:hypothetical protein CL656_03980 [bacterium]|nr:hypothetical protein [bacterium]|tara:strand:- start:1576 stop:1851 length:276 start_codon:yes stop_codon:yes gene_type:complete